MTQSGEPNRAFPVIAIALGALVAAAGLWFVGAYIFGAVIDRLGEPDQSLLFWYLPIAFIGIACLAVGSGAVVFGVSRMRRMRAQSEARHGGS